LEDSFDIELIQHEVVMLAVFAGDINLLSHTAILFIPTRIAAVDDDMCAGRQRTVLPDEVKVAVVCGHRYILLRS
jgi:hypothetical protein